ncbi:hypothetical protein CTA1_2297 [Colletotrichum tanaceti]|uniref:Uncharacterized protein n=1 Tax=Colletotrichum tanaceti TaxID=1306861 RepID=A0A4U6XGN0_9PEZI|nr:hypothetical protein CTA1_2297 [Colletotrichum tanaceti]
MPHVPEGAMVWYLTPLMAVLISRYTPTKRHTPTHFVSGAMVSRTSGNVGRDLRMQKVQGHRRTLWEVKVSRTNG